MAVTQPALSRSPGTTSVSWPGGKAWLRLSPHQSEVCGLGFLVRELQTGSVRAGPPGRQTCLSGQREARITVHPRGWGWSGIQAAVLYHY